jgi:ankyrin repeat protein
MSKSIRILLFLIAFLGITTPTAIEIYHLVGQSSYDAAIFYTIALFFAILGLSILFFNPYKNGFSWKKTLQRLLVFLIAFTLIVLPCIIVDRRTNQSFEEIVYAGHTSRVKRIVNDVKYKNTRLSDYEYMKALNNVIQKQDWKMVETLLDYTINFDSLKYNYDLPLSIAIKNNSVETYKKLVELGINPLDGSGQQLYYALQQPELLEQILKTGINANTTLIINHKATIPAIHRLVDYIDNTRERDPILWSSIETFIKYGANINLTDTLGLTPLLYTDKTNIKEKLIAMGATPVESFSYYFSELYKAIEKEDVQTVNNILEDNPLLANMGNKDGIRPLHLACRYYSITDRLNTDIINLLLNHGANPNVKTTTGNIPLLNLDWSKNVIPAAQLLLKQDANINAEKKQLRDIQGQTIMTKQLYNVNALRLALESNNNQAAIFLLKNGAIPDNEILQYAKNIGFDNEIQELIMKNDPLNTKQ